jgi:hypothetical protein
MRREVSGDVDPCPTVMLGVRHSSGAHPSRSHEDAQLELRVPSHERVARGNPRAEDARGPEEKSYAWTGPIGLSRMPLRRCL